MSSHFFSVSVLCCYSILDKSQSDSGDSGRIWNISVVLVEFWGGLEFSLSGFLFCGNYCTCLLFACIAPLLKSNSNGHNCIKRISLC